MVKVRKHFFCMIENKTYNIGDDYKGTRKDIDNYLEIVRKKTKKTIKPEETKVVIPGNELI